MTPEEAVIQLTGAALNIAAEALRRVLADYVEAEWLTEKLAENIYNAASTRAVELCNIAFAERYEMEAKLAKIIEPSRPKLITLEEHHE